MSDEAKAEMMRALLAAGLVALQWWLMEPQHGAVLARFWHWLALVLRRVALVAGRAALNAEYNYYVAVEAGI